MSEAMRHFGLWTAGSGRSPKTIQNWRTAFKAFMVFHLGQYYGHIWLFKDLSAIELCKMVAKSAIFASPDVVYDVVHGSLGTDENKNGLCNKANQCNNANNRNYWMGTKGNPYASWDHCVHARDNKVKKENPTKDCNGLPCIADDNTSANKAIKYAIKEKYSRLGLVSGVTFSDYVACHIWDNPNDCRYYASIANLVLVPRAIYGLTDHCNEVKAVLRKRAHYLFGQFTTLPPISPADLSSIANIYPRLIWRQP